VAGCIEVKTSYHRRIYDAALYRNQGEYCAGRRHDSQLINLTIGRMVRGWQGRGASRSSTSKQPGNPMDANLGTQSETKLKRPVLL